MGSISVLYLHQDGQLTGSAISLRNLLQGLDRERYQPRVLLAREGPARKLYEALDIPVDMIPIRGMWTFPGPRFPKLDYFRNWMALFPNLKLRAYLQNLKPTLVHINDKTLLPAGWTAHDLGLPIVWHLRSSYTVSNSRLHAKLSCNLIRRTADQLIAISEDETDGFEDFSNLSIIYNSVDFKQVAEATQHIPKIHTELGLDKDEILVGTVSTAINEIRGSWDFIEAAGRLQSLLPEKVLRFVIVAKILKPETEAEAWARAERAGIRDRLTLTGFRSDALSLMAAMDVVILCNRHGVLGRMPFEAMALGRPMVVTAGHSGRSQVVVNGETALVVPPADSEQLAMTTKKLIELPELGQRLGKNGVIYARQHFDPKKNAQAVMKIYDEILYKKRHV